MYSYNVKPEADRKAFEETCALIRTKIPSAKEEELLEDVDGTQIQIYTTPKGKIKIVNDYEVGAVYVDADVNLNNILN